MGIRARFRAGRRARRVQWGTIRQRGAQVRFVKRWYRSTDRNKRCCIRLHRAHHHIHRTLPLVGLPRRSSGERYYSPLLLGKLPGFLPARARPDKAAGQTRSRKRRVVWRMCFSQVQRYGLLGWEASADLHSDNSMGYRILAWAALAYHFTSFCTPALPPAIN